ncbi:MAG: tyrosine-type recombinase/integrase [Kiritimatiellia bacterium]
MAIFLRGDIWWIEYRAKGVRIVKSTGLRKKDRAKAQAVMDAVRLSMGAKPVRSAMEKLLDAIYETGCSKQGVPLSCAWALYEDWFRGKNKNVAESTWRNRRTAVSRFCEFAAGRGVDDICDVSVEVARQYVKHLVYIGKSNKTVRNIALDLSCVWSAIGQLRPDVHNPWKAACPDKDGTEESGRAFSAEEEKLVLSAAREVGHGWYEASMIARYTGQRYGDVARLDWSRVDLDAGVVRFRPSKTARSGFSVAVPMHNVLREMLYGMWHGQDGFVLPIHGTAYQTRKRLEVTFADVLALAGLPGGVYTFHSWRHTFRTRLAEAGVSDAVAARFGWTNLTMSAHYDHATHIDEMRAAVDALV